MKSVRWRIRTAVLGSVVVSLSGCGVVPVPGVLQPVFGRPSRYTDTSVCVVDRSAPRGLRVVAAQKEENSGRLYVRENGKRRRLPTSSAAGYAAEARWFRGDEPIRQYGRRYVKHGPRRVVPATELTLGADHRGSPVYIGRRDTERPSALYIPVEPGCVFQPYVDQQYSGSASN